MRTGTALEIVTLHKRYGSCVAVDGVGVNRTEPAILIGIAVTGALALPARQRR